MTYIHAPLITAHAPTIGALHPTRNRDRDLADAITLEQIRSQNRPREVKASQGGGGDLVPVKKTKQIPRFRLEAVSDTRLGRMPQYNTQTVTELVPRGVGGGAPIRRVSSGSAPSTSTDSDYKVTGTSIFNRPDKESTWDGNRWIRKWLPGEKEAEAQQRVGDVKLAQRKDLESYMHGLSKERAELDSLLATERGVISEKLKAILGAPTIPGTAVKSPFSDAPADTGTGNGSELDKQQAAVMSELDGIAADARAKAGLPQQPEQSDDLKMLVDSIAGQGGEVVADAGGDTSDDISGVYANGGSIFGGQDGGDGENALAWLRPDEAAGEPSISGDAVADEFASSMGDMINALMRKDSNYV